MEKTRLLQIVLYWAVCVSGFVAPSAISLTGKDPCLFCECATENNTLNTFSVKCSKLQLKQIPQNFPGILRSLEIHGTSLPNLSDDSFIYYPQLERLVLAVKGLYSISRNALRGLTKLRQLTIKTSGTLDTPNGFLSSLQSLSLIVSYLPPALQHVLSSVCHCISRTLTFFL